MTSQDPYSGPEIDAAIRILREDASLAHNRAVVARLDKLEQRLERVPVKEMTPEEKAAEYDRLMAGGGPTPPAPSPTPGQPPAPKGEKDPEPAPPAPPAKPPKEPNDGPVKRSWWDAYQGGGAA